MSETFEQAIERCLMDGTTAKALRLIAADFDDESNGFIEIAALQQGADGLDTLVARVADLTASRDRASDACASVQRERDDLREMLGEAVATIRLGVEYDDLLLRYKGPHAILFDGDVAEIDAAYDKWVSAQRAFLSRYEGEVK